MSKVTGFINYKNSILEKTYVKNPIVVIAKTFDIYHWVKHKHLMLQEYFQFEFVHKSHKEKKQYVLDWEVMNLYGIRCNSHKVCELLDDKFKFNELFSNMIGRDYIYIGPDDYNKFVTFAANHRYIMVKSVDLLGGSGIKKYDLLAINLEEVFSDICQRGTNVLVEEVLEQHPSMASLCSDTVNTIRVITMRDQNGTLHIPFANVRVGRAGQCVDNFCAGGMTAGISMESGTIFTPGYDKFGNELSCHPDTGTRFVGFEIPQWNEILKTVKVCADRISDGRYIGWDIAVQKNGKIAIIEANSNPEARLHQIVAGAGLRSIYNKYLGDVK